MWRRGGGGGADFTVPPAPGRNARPLLLSLGCMRGLRPAKLSRRQTRSKQFCMPSHTQPE